jgi:hypothetical protein
MSNRVELRYEEYFKAFLFKKFENGRVISDCISRCKRVQRHEGNLVDHYISDLGKSLLDKLNYSLQDVNKKKEPKHSISFQGNKGYKTIYEGTKSLESAVNHYFVFLSQYKGSNERV